MLDEAFSRTTQTYNALYFNISQFPNMTQQFSNRGIYENGILSLTYFADYMVETCQKMSIFVEFIFKLFVESKFHI